MMKTKDSDGPAVESNCRGEDSLYASCLNTSPNGREHRVVCRISCGYRIVLRQNRLQEWIVYGSNLIQHCRPREAALSDVFVGDWNDLGERTRQKRQPAAAN